MLAAAQHRSRRTVRTHCIALLSLMSLGFLLMGVTSIAFAQNTTKLTGHSIFSVNIRSTPGMDGGVIAVLPGGKDITAVGRTVGNNWIQIEHGGTIGWVAAWLLVFSGDTSLLPITTDYQPAPASTGGPFILYSPYNVNIRAEPRVSAAILTRLPFNTEALATGRSDNSSWVRVRYNDIEGWVAAWLVILDNDISALPVAGGAVLPTSTPGPNTIPTLIPTGTSLPPTSSPAGVTVQAPFRVNIRSAPSLSGSIIGILPYSQPVAAVGRNAANNWIQVEHSQTRGWVAAWLVLGSEDTLSLPVTSDSAEVAPTDKTITIKSVYNVIVRAGPGLEYAPLYNLPANTEATAVARTGANNWFKITYQDKEGWVAAWVVVASADPTNLSVEQGSGTP